MGAGVTLEDILSLGFFELASQSGIRYFRLYEVYKDSRFQILLSYLDGQFKLERVFFYEHAHLKLEAELFGVQPSVSSIIAQVRELQTTNGRFNCDVETG